MENTLQMDTDDSSTENTVKDMLFESLGKFYFEAHLHCPPTFLQVVGWTKGAEKENAKRLHVYVRKVPMLIKNSPTGGFWNIDYDIVKQYKSEIITPIYNNKSPLVSGTAIIIPDGKFLRYSGITVPIYDI